VEYTALYKFFFDFILTFEGKQLKKRIIW